MNPYVLLGLGIFYLASVAGAYFKGGQIERDHAKAEYSKQLEGEIKQANENALIDMEAARAWGESNAKIVTKFREVQGETRTVVVEKPMPAVCNLGPDRMRLLQTAISIANQSSSSGVRADPGADKPAEVR